MTGPRSRTRPMRVLVMIDSLRAGGAAQSMSSTVPHLVKRGVELHYAYLRQRPGIADELIAEGVTIHDLSGKGGRAAWLARASRTLRAVRPDLVHTTLFEADLIGRCAAWPLRIPVVSSLVAESYGPEHVGNPLYRAWKVRGFQLVDMVTARLVTRFHAVSNTTADVMAQRLRIPRDRIDVISRGRDPQRLGVRTPERRAAARASLGVGDGAPLLFAAARHHFVKGLDILLRAFPNVTESFPKARLVIAGRDGQVTPNLEQLAEELGMDPAAVLIGNRSDVPDLMCAADVFILPSRSEGSPGALIEAMALEAPAVATDIPSVREVAGDGPRTVSLTRPESPDELGRAITELLSDPDRAAEQAAAARARFIDHYTMDAIADATVALYRRCLRH